MRKVSFLVLLILVLFLVSCKKEKEIDKGELEQTIFVVSDIHLLSNNLIDETYSKANLITDGRCQELDYDLVKALVKKVNEEKPDYLIITGDLTFNGEYDSHVELIKLLDEITDTKVLVIPGNHDCYNLNSYSYLDNKIRVAENISFDQFENLYDNYGYNDALYKEDFHSYIYELSENKWALMINTNLSDFNEELGTNVTRGTLHEETYNWMEEKLQYASEHNIEVISFMHHNLITHHAMFEKNYTLGCNNEVLELYKKYNVKINFSGHLHIQDIKENDGIYDIASVGLLDYGNRYGVFKIYSNAYEYEAFMLELDNMDLKKYSFDTFYNKYYDKVKLDESVYGKDFEKVKDLMCKINTYYFDGDFEAVNKLKKENRKYYDMLFKNTESEYIKEILTSTGKNQTYLIVEK